MVKPRENRVPMMLSEEELKAIDDWRYENKVPTRSDAIRRLCQIALIVDARLTPVTVAVNNHSKEVGELLQSVANYIDPKSEKKSALRKLSDGMSRATNKLQTMQYTIREVTARIYDFKKSTPFEVSVSDAEKNEALFQNMISTLNEFGDLQKKFQNSVPSDNLNDEES